MDFSSLPYLHVSRDEPIIDPLGAYKLKDEGIGTPSPTASKPPIIESSPTSLGSLDFDELSSPSSQDHEMDEDVFEINEHLWTPFQSGMGPLQAIFPEPPSTLNGEFSQQEFTERSLEDERDSPIHSVAQRSLMEPTTLQEDLDRLDRIHTEERQNLRNSMISCRSINPFTRTEESISEQEFLAWAEEINVTGVTNALTLPTTWVSYIKRLIAAVRQSDREGIVEYSMKVFSIPFGIANAVVDIISMAYVVFKSIKYTTLTVTSFAFGIVFLTIEFFLELSRLVRSVEFRNSANAHGRIKTIRTLDEKLEAFRKVDVNKATNPKARVKALQDLSYQLYTMNKKLDKVLGVNGREHHLGAIHRILLDMERNPTLSIIPLEEAFMKMKLEIASIGLQGLYEDYLHLTAQEIAECDHAAQSIMYLQDLQNRALDEVYNSLLVEEDDDLGDETQPLIKETSTPRPEGLPIEIQSRYLSRFTRTFGLEKGAEILETLNARVQLAGQEDIPLAGRAVLLEYDELFKAAKEERLKGKLNALSRRVQPVLALHLQATVRERLQGIAWLYDRGLDLTTFKTTTEMRRLYLEESLTDLEQVDQQATKTMIVHIIGIMAISLGILSIAFTFAGFPPAAVAIVVVIGIIIQMHRAKAEAAFLKQEGYKWSYFEMLPDFVKNFFKDKDEEVEVQRTKLVPIRFSNETGKHVPGTANFKPDLDEDGKPLPVDYGTGHESARKHAWWHNLPFSEFFF